MKKVLFFIFVLLVLLVGFAFIGNRDKILEGKEEKDFGSGLDDLGGSNIEAVELKGSSLSPKGFQQDDFTDFFVKADEVGDAVTGWAEIEDFSEPNSVPIVVAGLASQYNYEPIILIGLKNAQSAEPYKYSLNDFVVNNDIKYLGLGVEVNRYSDFNKYAKIYN